MQQLVSIVIPVYNVEQYLKRCVDSVLKQSYQNMEIILVNDGSTDSSMDICNHYKRVDSRIQVVHKRNGGLASARNAGMRLMKGEYLFFLDSDDWIESETIEELVLVAEKYEVDFVRFRPMYAGWPNHADGSLCDFGTEAGMKEKKYLREDIEREIYPRLIATDNLNMGAIVAAWRSLYRVGFILNNNLFFNENIRYSEDSLFSALLLTKTNSFYYLDGPRYYHYYYNPASITKSFRQDRWESCLRLMDSFEKEFGHYKNYDFTKQLRLQNIYCVMVAVNQANNIEDINKRKKYLSALCRDKKVIDIMKYISLVHGGLKLKLKLLAIKYKLIGVLAEGK